jgi:pSer/pThr/pTyr-binding forkhead associated (FHA) protein
LKVSRSHAELRLLAGVLEVADLGSTNGTFVNGDRLKPHEPRPLHPGDEVCFGATKFTCAK